MQPRPVGLPPIRPAFAEPVVPQNESQPVFTSNVIVMEEEAQAKIKKSSSKSGVLVNTLLQIMALCICVFTFFISAFVIGNHIEILFFVHVNLTDVMVLQLFLGMGSSRVP